MCDYWGHATSQYGNTALIVAVVEGHVDSVRLLLVRGADIDAKNDVSPPSRRWGCRALSAPSRRQASSLLQSHLARVSPNPPDRIGCQPWVFRDIS